MPPQGQLLVHESLFKRQKMPGQLKRLQKKKSKSAWSVLLPGLCCPSGERAGGWDERHLEASQQNPSITFLRVKPPGKTTPSPVSLALFPGGSPEVGDGRHCGCCRHPPGTATAPREERRVLSTSSVLRGEIQAPSTASKALRYPASK